jgi:hypothetical protein
MYFYSVLIYLSCEIVIEFELEDLGIGMEYL